MISNNILKDTGEITNLKSEVMGLSFNNLAFNDGKFEGPLLAQGI